MQSPDPAVGTPSGLTAYLAADGFLDDLLGELGPVEAVHGRLVLAQGPARPTAWAQNVWFDPLLIPIDSIGDAAGKLRAIQRNWVGWQFHLHGRAKLIQERLPPLKQKPIAPFSPVPTAPLGSWTLLDERTILAAPRCSSPWPHGEVQFLEDKDTPPNRAYLKAWEILTLEGVRPQPGEVCLDLGSSPGGWTWVLQSLGAQVVSVDKAPLDPKIGRLPRIDYRQQSAFALTPAEVPDAAWLFSDVICYPERLHRLVQAWMAESRVRHFICTIKFQGPTDHHWTQIFRDIPGSVVRHLHHNKHELTWTLHR